MKRIGTIITLTVILIAFIFGIRYIYLKDQKDPSKIADHIAAQLNISIFEKQKLL